MLASFALVFLPSLPIPTCSVSKPQDPSRDGEFDEGSFVEIEQVSTVQAESLVTLGKVWGFLKYHHPLVTSGAIDWDAALFRVLPEVLDAPDRASLGKVLLAWTAEIGESEPCAPCAEPIADAHLQPDLDWIDDQARLGVELSAALRRVHGNRSAAERQRYVSFVPGIGNPTFLNEDAHERLSEPDAGYRLLALFRFWNVIEYWFPYRDVIGEDWDRVLAEFVPRLVAARGGDEYRLQLMALIARAHDTHANLWGSLDVRPPRGEASLPIVVRFVEDRAVVAELLDAKVRAGMAQLRAGDVLLALDGTPVKSLVEAWSPFYAASNDPTRLRDIASQLTRGVPGAVKVQLERDGETLELAATRLPRSEIGEVGNRWHDLDGDTFRRLSPDVAYLKLSSVKAAEVADHLRAAEGTRGLVIDIRNYPSEFVVFSLGQLLVRESTPFARFTTGVASNPGAFVWTDSIALEPMDPHYAGRVVVLLDESSQSQAEYTAMALRAAPDVRIVGSTTAGADGNVSALPLPGGLRTMISGIGVFYPDKTPTQRVGIVPDVEVKPTIAGLREGRDEVLEAALREILGKETPEAEIRRIADAALGERH